MTTPHEPTIDCHRDHCYSHNIDEPATGRSYHMACGECFHLFRTRWNLWADHLHTAARLYWADITAPRRTANPHPPLHNDPFGNTSTLGPWRASSLLHLALLPFTRPSRIHTCPHCAHDL